MTIYESIAAWLSEILSELPEEAVTWIDLETVPENLEFQNAGLFSSPNDIHSSLIGGQQRHTVFKTFYIKRRFLENEDRIGNEKFLEDLKGAIVRKNLDGIMPEDNRSWRSIEYIGGAYPSQIQENNQWAFYQIILKLVYRD